MDAWKILMEVNIQYFFHKGNECFKVKKIFWQICESLEPQNIWFGSTCENVQFFGLENVFLWKIFFSLKAPNSNKT